MAKSLHRRSTAAVGLTSRGRSSPRYTPGFGEGSPEARSDSGRNLFPEQFNPNTTPYSSSGQPSAGFTAGNQPYGLIYCREPAVRLGRSVREPVRGFVQPARRCKQPLRALVALTWAGLPVEPLSTRASELRALATYQALAIRVPRALDLLRNSTCQLPAPASARSGRTSSSAWASTASPDARSPASYSARLPSATAEVRVEAGEGRPGDVRRGTHAGQARLHQHPRSHKVRVRDATGSLSCGCGYAE